MDPVAFDVNNSKIKDEVYVFDDFVASVSDVELVDLQLSVDRLGEKQFIQFVESLWILFYFLAAVGHNNCISEHANNIFAVLGAT